ncbi:metallo-dependent phosphatase-like domain-containing protein [Leishmania tarentolae]|uniref:Metallo-dependent phosphatase-like domain-containing protein n=1 Tax=Leishmania tarentolae TaxID=5689 RepID=A0A640KF81_LEITA|nr:metallo-dependent phosphatase-like domain-containing protein [Leishmania tarentolae]
MGKPHFNTKGRLIFIFVFSFRYCLTAQSFPLFQCSSTRVGVLRHQCSACVCVVCRRAHLSIIDSSFHPPLPFSSLSFHAPFLTCSCALLPIPCPPPSLPPIHKMPGWWGWSVGSANPFVSFSTVWIEPLIQNTVDFSHRIEPEVLCTLVYLACMGSAYLFHSPFRAHSTAAMDTYGRVTKVFQSWSTIIFFCFHLGPKFLKEKREETITAHAQDTAPILFFPLFIIFTIWFAFLHKIKRRWGIGLTYGSRFSVIVLNSLVLAALCTVHYAYCYTLNENASHDIWRFVLYYLMPSSVATRPFRCVSKLLCFSAFFLVADYHYKKWMGLDPARGILWAELYELNKGIYKEALVTERDGKAHRRDWRELVAPPRIYAPAALRSRYTAVQAGVPAASGVPAVHKPFTPRVLYHECLPAVNLDLLESSYAEDDADLRRILDGGVRGVPAVGANHICSTSAADDPSVPHDSFAGPVSRLIHKVSPIGPTLTNLMSFRTPQLVVRKAQKALHPLNRPGMVPWWSTFVLFTAWQTAASATLRFLAFDVRTIQGYTTPKIFHLHFSSSLRGTIRSAAEALGHPATTQPRANGDIRSTSLHLGSLTAADGTPEASRGGENRGVCDANGGVRERPASVDAETPPPTEPDVWFDWIADVGDGFNPTYAMARLLAQPALCLPLKITRQAQRWRRFARGLHKFTSASRADTSSVMASGTVSAPSSPTSSRRSVADNGEAERELRRAASFSSITGTDGDDEKATSTSARTLPLPLSARTPGAAAAQGSTFSPTRRAREDLQVEGVTATDTVVANSAMHAQSTAHCRAPSRHTQRVHDTSFSSVLKGEKNAFVTLPRGSFVLVGGDLAYPSPNDETYTTRLFDPYHDAMSSNVRLQSLFHAEQRRVVVEDANDADVAHVHLLDAETVSRMATGRSAQRTGRATAEEALRSVPLLFAIPGNHDWFDGLTTYRKYILERTWIGGWLMPQRSSFFVLRLPHNWFVLCGDTGNMQDIDVAQRNYFLDVIEKYMDAESCVILAAHEPGWVLDAMERDDKARQPELNRVVEALGTRLRLRLAGDIHHYSRHTPRDANSEAATLVVSGGGGAFLHGPRNDVVISQGTTYVRACAFPHQNTFMNMASRLWGFRVINWKFDLVVGFLCFVLLLSVLPLPMELDVNRRGAIGNDRSKMRLAQVFSLWVGYTTEIMSHVIMRGVISLFSFVFFLVCFSFAGADRHAPLLWRLCYGGGWAFAVLLCCSGAMAFLHVQLLYLMSHDLLQSAEGYWGTELENHLVLIVNALVDHLRHITGGEASWVSRHLRGTHELVLAIIPTGWLRVLLRCFDPFESLGFLSMAVSGGEVARFSAAASRLQIVLYYVYVLFFYWVLITPVVSVLIGMFLLFSVTTFDYMYDATYSAFQMEEYKHFLRFRLDATTRELHGYVVALQKPSKVYQLDRSYLWSLTGPGLEQHRPPHLKQYPSRWEPVLSDARCKRPMTEVLEHFTVAPHRVSQRPKRPITESK